MLVALVNDVFLSTPLQGELYRELLLNLTKGRVLVEMGLLVALCFVGYTIRGADQAVNLASFGKGLVDE